MSFIPVQFCPDNLYRRYKQNGGIIMAGKTLQNINLKNIRIHDASWDRYINLVEDVILPFEWKLINDLVPGAEKSYCMQNFRIAAGQETGAHRGMVFQDTDVAKWLEAVGYSLSKKSNARLEAVADEAIDLIAAAQCEDGYLNTYYTIRGEARWKDLFEGHELYTAGHMIEAAAAYYQATGKRKLLDVVCHFADYICTVFGPEEGKLHAYPGHPEIELALIKLYRLTENAKYLDLAAYFIQIRGEQPCYFSSEENYRNGTFIFPEFKDFTFDYCQADRPLMEQDKAEGHAVRAVYLYSAMADLAFEQEDEKLLEHCRALWENIVQRQMYITGSIGSASYGERFTTDYDLPNSTNYSESCATIGLAMFSNRMFQGTRDGQYMDTVEQALYNTLLAGIALDGQHYFYVNPLELVPEIAENNPTMRHIMTERQQWFGVACCPPNITRTLASIGNYMIAAEGDTCYVNLYLACDVQAPLQSGTLSFTLEADYPESGTIMLCITEAIGASQTLAVRIPAYSRDFYRIRINGKDFLQEPHKGYAYLSREWRVGDQIQLELSVSFRFVYCNPRVRDNLGRVCIMRGPQVYCFEEADNGSYLAACRVDTSQPIREAHSDDLPGGILCAIVEGDKAVYHSDMGALYSGQKPEREPVTLRSVPYSRWNNRGRGEMQVWMRDKDG